MIELNPVEIRALRAQAHHLKPVVQISQHGLSDPVIKEIDRSLTAHALIKVRLYGIERAERETALAEICARLDCSAVQHIGNILVLWRQKPAAADAPRTRRGAKPQTKKQAAAAAERKGR